MWTADGKPIFKYCTFNVKVKMCQHEHKPHKQGKFQATASSREDAVIIFKGLNFYDGHCVSYLPTNVKRPEYHITYTVASSRSVNSTFFGAFPQ